MAISTPSFLCAGRGSGEREDQSRQRCARAGNRAQERAPDCARRAGTPTCARGVSNTTTTTTTLGERYAEDAQDREEGDRKGEAAEAAHQKSVRLALLSSGASSSDAHHGHVVDSSFQPQQQIDRPSDSSNRKKNTPGQHTATTSHATTPHPTTPLPFPTPRKKPTPRTFSASPRITPVTTGRYTSAASEPSAHARKCALWNHTPPCRWGGAAASCARPALRTKSQKQSSGGGAGRGGAGQDRQVREVKAGSRRGQGGSERTIIHVRLGHVGRETGKLQTFEVRHATRRNKTRERADS